MSPRLIPRAVLTALAIAPLFGCTRNLPPPCTGEQCANWPHFEVRFWRDRQGSRSGRRYTGALCVQVAVDCPEEGRHVMWVEPNAPRCRTYLNHEGPEWLRVTTGRVSIPWPAQCRGNRVEVYVSAQPNFAVCPAVNNQLVTIDRSSLQADVNFDCRQ